MTANKCFFERIHSSNLIKLRHIFDKHTLWKCHEPVSYTNDTRLLNIRKYKFNVRIRLQMSIKNSPIKLTKKNYFCIYLYISNYEKSTNLNHIWRVNVYIYVYSHKRAKNNIIKIDLCRKCQFAKSNNCNNFDMSIIMIFLNWQ